MLASRAARGASARLARRARPASASLRSAQQPAQRSAAVVRRAAYSTQQVTVSAADIKKARQALQTEATAQAIFAQTLQPSPQWDKLLSLGERLSADQRAQYTSVINDIRASRGDLSEVENAFRTGNPLPDSHPLADDLNAFVGKFDAKDLQEASDLTIFGQSAGNPDTLAKFGAIGAEVNDALKAYDEGQGDEELDEQFAAEEDDEDGGRWAEVLADALAGADGADVATAEAAFQAAEAVRQHSFAPELFENPTLADGEAFAAEQAYWEHKEDGAGTPYTDATFTDAELAFLIHVAKTSSKFEGAVTYFKDTLQSKAPSRLIVDQYLEYAFVREKIDEVFKGLEEIKARGLPISADGYATAVRAAAAKGDNAKAVQLFQEAKAAGEATSSRIYAALIFSYGKAKQLDKARAVLKDMEKDGVAPDGLVYHALVLAEFKNGKQDAWERIKKEMAERNVAPHPLSQVFTENEQLDALVPKVPRKARTAAQRNAKRSITNASVLSPKEAARLMEVIEEKAFQRKQGIFVRDAGRNYTPIAPEYNTVGGATTQRIHVNRLIVSAHRFPHHHRVSPLAKYLIEGYFMDGNMPVAKPKKGAKPVPKPTAKGFAEGDVASLQAALKNITDRLGDSARAGEAVLQLPEVLETLVSAQGLFTDPQLRAQSIKALEKQAARDVANAAHYQEVIEWTKKQDGSPPKKVNPKAIQTLFSAFIKSTAEAAKKEEKEPLQPGAASDAAADLYTQVLKRVAQSDKKKAAFVAHALDGWFKKEKRDFVVDASSLTVNKK